MNPYGEFGKPIRLLEAYKDWQEHALQEADSKADFAEFLFGPIKTSLYGGYNRVQSQWRRYVRTENMPDFRERRIRGLNSLTGLGYVGDHGEYPQMRRTDRPPASLVIDTYGGVYSITRQAIRNDDTGELLNRNPADMGFAAGNFVAETIISFIESNPTAPDGNPTFSAGRGNEVTAPLSEDALADAITFMEDQQDPDGYRIRITPSLLAVKSARMQMIAKRIINSTETGTSVNWDGGTAGVGSDAFDKGNLNVLAGVLPPDAVVRDPFWTATNNWYLFTNPGDIPAFAAGFLDGREEPFVGLKDPQVRNALGPGVDPYTYELDSVDFKVRLDFGVATVDPRGVFRSVVA
jgi:hypothetical protein